MSRYQSSYLLAMLLTLLAARGLQPEGLDPWHTWMVFKQFAREAAEEPDPGLSVQIDPVDDGRPIHLYLVRQLLVPEDDRLEPTGGVVCEFVFAPRRLRPREWREWSFDYPSFDRFVDVVEQNPVFADLLLTRPLHTAVYFEEA
jgi:hypothetical protein